jgi:hypothetical protein
MKERINNYLDTTSILNVGDSVEVLEYDMEGNKIHLGNSTIICVHINVSDGWMNHVYTIEWENTIIRISEEDEACFIFGFKFIKKEEI